MENAKCILLSRVSTHSQDLKQQTDELIAAAHRDGFTDEDIITIEDKESAIKLSEEERNGLNELKRHINTDPSITCVYVYEVSRIARKEKILFSIRDFLIEKNIQLVVLTPYMKLLDENHEMTQASQIMFALFGTLSESEMHIKKQRMLRGKKAKAELGYYIGGPLLFGYKTDENNKIIIDEPKANVVRKMFDLYLKKQSISAVTTELYSTGEFEKPYWRLVYNNIYKMLIRPEFYGGHGDTANTNYPPIISKELFDKVQVILHNRSRPHTKTKYIYYAHKLLRCRSTGRCFYPTISCCCYRHGGGVYLQNEETRLRVVAWNVSMELVDSVLWHFTKKYRKSHSASDVKKMRKDLEEKISVLHRKITKGKKDIEVRKSQILKANERIVMGRMSDEQGDKLIDRIKGEIEELEEKIVSWDTNAFNMNCEYQMLDIGFYNKSIEDIVDEQERHDVIHNSISVVWVDKLGYGSYKYEIVFSDDSSICFCTKPSIYNRIFLEDGTIEYFEQLNRYSRK